MIPGCFGLPTMEGKTARGASSPAKPAYNTMKMISFMKNDKFYRKNRNLRKNSAELPKFKLTYFAHTGTVINNKGLNIFVGHFIELFDCSKNTKESVEN
jgi:hypothetical protein